MTTQPNALRLAEWLDYWQQPTAKEAAAELRRLHDRITALESALGMAVEALGFYEQAGVSTVQSCEALAAARQTLGEIK